MSQLSSDFLELFIRLLSVLLSYSLNFICIPFIPEYKLEKLDCGEKPRDFPKSGGDYSVAEFGQWSERFTL